MDNFNNVQIEDSNEFNISQLGIKEIALEQYRRCIVEGSKEMVRGGVTKKVIGDKIIETEIPNQREVFKNAVASLHNLLIPFLTRGEFQEKVDKIDEKFKALKKNFKTAIKSIPSECTFHDKNNKKRIDEIKLQYLVETYKDINDYELVELSREKLQIFSLLLNDLEYFSQGGGFA